MALLPLSWAQISSVLSVTAPERTAAKRGTTFVGKVTVQLRGGYHVNSNSPKDEYLIPLRLTWQASPLRVVKVTYPKPKLETYSFSEKPVSVFTDDFDILTEFEVPQTAPLGPSILIGKLRYQACNDSSCLPPRTVEARLPVHIQ
jgi:thiol:disulfide interchange protein DsbD